MCLWIVWRLSIDCHVRGKWPENIAQARGAHSNETMTIPLLEDDKLNRLIR
jgi:hypothetical protein